MAAVILTVDDLTPFADIGAVKAEAMIVDAMAMATVIAPCIATADFAYEGAARAVIRGAILRWNDSGTGALTQQGAGPFQVSYDNRQARRTLFWPTEINQLQDLCKEVGQETAFTVDTVDFSVVHSDTCSYSLGATYCDCGAVLAGYPLFS